MKHSALCVLIAACGHGTPAVSSCNDRLQGAWRTPDGTRWMILDNARTLEAYPLFDDAVDGGAPRVLDLTRGKELAGTMSRRFTRGGDDCVARAAVAVTACRDNALQLVLSEPVAPLTFAPCTWSDRTASSQVERWLRE